LPSEDIHNERMYAEPALSIELLDGPSAQERIEHLIRHGRSWLPEVDVQQPAHLVVVGDSLRVIWALAKSSLVLGS
jgi:hypothetical protein